MSIRCWINHFLSPIVAWLDAVVTPCHKCSDCGNCCYHGKPCINLDTMENFKGKN